MRTALSTVFLAIACAACTVREPVGRNLPKPWIAPGVAIGASRETDVLAVYGEPIRRIENATARPQPASDAGPGPSTDTTLTFRNSDRIVASLFPAVIIPRVRTFILRFHNGVLAGYGFDSSFPEDGRLIDFNMAEAKLRQHDTTLADLTPILGPPQARQTFSGAPTLRTVIVVHSPDPLMITPPPAPPSEPVQEVDTWTSTVWRNDFLASKETLVVTLGQDGRILRYNRNASINTPA